MKFTCSVVIQAPKDKVAQLFANPNYLHEYQDGFVKKELKSGTAGQEGAISKMYYQTGKRKMVITEEILVNDLPDEFVGHYHHEHMDNTMRCIFTALDNHQTLYESEIEYTTSEGSFLN